MGRGGPGRPPPPIHGNLKNRPPLIDLGPSPQRPILAMTRLRLHVHYRVKSARARASSKWRVAVSRVPFAPRLQNRVPTSIYGNRSSPLTRVRYLSQRPIKTRRRLSNAGLGNALVKISAG